MKYKVLILFLIIYVTKTKCARYVLPQLTIKALEGGGLQITMPVTPGEDLELFGFHGNINGNIRGKEQGQISRTATTPIGNKWILTDKTTKLKLGDKVYYWIFAQSNRLGFDREDQVFEVKGFEKLSGDSCVESVSKFNSDESLCKNEIILEDDFNNEKLNEDIWDVHSYIPTYLDDHGDNEFVVYENNNENIFIKNGELNLKPTVKGSKTPSYEYTSNPCTFPQDDSENSKLACTLGSGYYGVLPPVTSARIVSKRSFKYARVEMRAKLSEGDWIIPQAVLLPRDYTYGPSYKSGAIYVAYARGNKNIVDNKVMLGPVVDDNKTKNLVMVPVQSGYHTFRVEWTPTGIITWVDDTKQPSGSTPNGGYKTLISDFNSAGSWKDNQGSSDTPFDQYFQLHLSVPVGGRKDFPDTGVNYGVNKPWTNTDPKAVISFLQSNFQQSWSEPTMVIDYVRVYAI